MKRWGHGDGSNFRGDIEGMRALAVVLVLIGHAGVNGLPGGFVGVDVFFVISGFLITGMLVRELADTGRISIVDFYTRRARRLLPAAGVVLVASLLLAYLFLPRLRWSSTGWDVLASGLYAMNWRLAEQAVNYLQADEAPSILQHFWSLAVEEQFYLIWPMLLLVLARTLRRRRHRLDRGRLDRGRLERRLLIGLALVAIPSLAWSIHLSEANPARAYFVTTTRMWELALGAGLAILGRHLIRIPRVLAAALGWAGVAAIVVAALVTTPDLPFPGHLALLPTLGAAAVIAAGAAAGRAGPVLLLGLPPMRALGALSYSLYLWHWPLLVAAEAKFGELRPAAGLAVVALSVVPAALTYRFVENPIRFSVVLPRQAAQLGALATGAPVIAALLFQLTVWPPARPPSDIAAMMPPLDISASGSAEPRRSNFGADVLGRKPRSSPAGVPVDRVDTITPDALSAPLDLPDTYRQDCLLEVTEYEPRPCSYGDPNSSFTMVLAGDSHAAHWLPALKAVAEANKWRLITQIKGSCPVENTPVLYKTNTPFDACTEWNKRLRATLTGPDKPQLLILSSLTYQPVPKGEPLQGVAALRARTDALRDTWSELADAGVRTVVIRDTPYFPFNVAECVSKNPEKLTRCSAPREKALEISQPQAEAAKGLDDIRFVDLNDAICPAERCAPVIGGVLIYRDAAHLTATYSRTLAPRLHEALREDLN
ncbi:acyltransferase family protein [Micromonospora sp. NBRC 107095]|uniref:acyltransferase family protein n=1 Tax=Micromonospora sp. NBRC 107095 TaxID=3032209 RepID=UPI0024A14D70|nr:acyltransferase family protein [Micromonospora sp. NBRC 107095]GLZ58282.1 acyltransferase [Micromonospora sp. NBRC 107095]